MPPPSKLESIIEKAVAEVLEAALPRLRSEIVQRATQDLKAIPAPEASSDSLSEAVESIQEATLQADILRKLLQGATHFAGRVALFIVKAGSISGWQGIGFENDDSVPGSSLSPSLVLVAEAMRSRSSATGKISDFDKAIMARLKAPAEDKCIVVPLVVKDKVAALLYVDGGAKSPVDGPALSTLSRFAGLWLEVNALRRNDHVPGDEPQTASATAAAAAPIPAVAPVVSEDSDVQRKARRFAKLLVEEIKLYNQPKVNEGKQNRDLYERLKEDIEKSRATYEKRYGQTPAAGADYFSQELVRILADNDIQLMGDGFQR